MGTSLIKCAGVKKINMGAPIYRFACLILLGSPLSIICGCNCDADRTSDPKYRFGGVAGRCYVLRQGVFMVRDDGEYWLYAPSNGDPYNAMPESVDAWRSGKDKIHWDPLASAIEDVVPAGTRIQVVRLVEETCESGSIIAYVKILDGRYAGKIASQWFLFREPGVMWPNDIPPTPWAPREEYLAPCTKAD